MMWWLLAAIESVEPTAIPLVAILLSSVAMYAVGILLPCSACCGCGRCVNTLTVTFDGITDQQPPGPDLCLLACSDPFTAAQGWAAAGVVKAPGGDPATDAGPITAVSLTDGGSGYAMLGRVAPTLTATSPRGNGATFSVQAASANDAEGIPSWAVTGVTWTGTTSGYVEGDHLEFAVADGDTPERQAVAVVRTYHTAPTVTASAASGTGATFTVALTASGAAGRQSWAVTGVTLTAGGTGHPESGTLTFTAGTGDTAQASAVASYRCGRVAPTLQSMIVSDGGAGGALSETLSSAVGFDGRTFWYVDSVAITSSGTGYAYGDYIYWSAGNGVSQGTAYGYVSSVDAAGRITGVSLIDPGQYYKSNGIISTVTLLSGGTYYRDTGELAAITIADGGSYWRDDPTADPYVRTVTVDVVQSFPSNGDGATFAATVDDDTASPTFGQIVAVAITAGGDGYLAWEWAGTMRCCGDFFNGMTVVVKQGTSYPCEYGHSMCGPAGAGGVAVFYEGPTKPPSLLLYAWPCSAEFGTSQLVEDCDAWLDQSGSPIVLHSPGGATAAVSAGGTYDATFRHKGNRSCRSCCQGHSAVPAEIEATINDPRPNTPGGDRSGTYVLTAGISWPPGRNQGWRGGYAGNLTSPEESSVEIQIWYEPCSSQTQETFIPDGWGCDDCHKKCRLMAEVLIRPNWGGGAIDVNQSNACDLCVDTPLCSAEGLSLSLTGGITLST